MIHFPRLLTARLDVQLRELTMREAVDMAAMPLHRHEATTSAFLAIVIAEARGQHTRPGRWTVQERALAVAHYLAACSSEGGNFPVGDGRFLDYLHPAADHPGDVVDAGSACGNAWRMTQLTGDQALAMESHCRTRFDWLSAGMAAQLQADDEKPEDWPDATDQPAEYSDWLRERMGTIQAMPEGEFAELFGVYVQGKGALFHLFELDVDAAGHILLGRHDGGGDRLTAPARFPVSSAIGRIAQILGSRAD